MSPRINLLSFKCICNSRGEAVLLYSGYIGMWHAIGYMVFEVLDP